MAKKGSEYRAPGFIENTGAMNSYLSIAAKVLYEIRQPLSARQILEAAYRLQIVPEQLFGKTQHKTLGARLSVDMLQHGVRSEFIRTAPGRYFLRALFNDPVVPQRYKREYYAPLRAAQLKRFDVLTFVIDSVAKLVSEQGRVSLRNLLKARGRFQRLSDLRGERDIAPLRIFVVLTSENKILFRGKMTADGRGQVRPALGIVDYIRRDDRSLFSQDPVGLHEAATRAISEQLRLPYHRILELEPAFQFSEVECLITDRDGGGQEVSAILRYKAPREMQSVWLGEHTDWEEMPLRINDIEALDPCSRFLLNHPPLLTAITTH